ncbi:hypothetical protein [Flavobacterium sp. NKUCC04_CG]|uniref:hypothetical protein n=1 Tax=Flavobacterium sp. NKUCC04_CG TaxID=2842121 RepID=UPI001C5AA6D1|nr:hypothetical protein [Flavobacterium sp. NKUCC04_CG]MBW3519878.1 hypothetical protein [Flavobacterium sp. NKUCC04_CG]
MIKKIIGMGLAFVAFNCGTIKTAEGASEPPIKKEQQQQSPLGTWVLVQRSGGITGATATFDPAAKEKVILIESNKFIVWEKDVKKSEQAYVIEKGKVIESTVPQDILKGEQSMPQSITFKDGNLVLRTQCYDCYTELYQRIR